MRINIYKNEEDSIVGYENIHINDRVKLEQFADGSVQEVQLSNALRFMRMDDMIPLFKKLSHEGQFKVVDIDFFQVSHSFVFGHSSIDDVNEMLQNSVTFVTYDLVVSTLQRVGLKIEQKRLTDFVFAIGAIRP